MAQEVTLKITLDDLDILLVALGELHIKEDQRLSGLLKMSEHNKLTLTDGTRMALKKWVCSIDSLRDRLRQSFLASVGDGE